MELTVTGGCQCKNLSADSKKISQFGEGSWGSLSRAVKPKDVPDTPAVRAGGTNWGVLGMFLNLTPKYLLLVRSREKVLSWSNLALTYCNHQVLNYSAAMWLSV